MTSRNYFQGKRIAVVGLGPRGEMVEDVKFLIKAGAIVSIYDLRSEARLKTHLVFLRTVGLANYVCGSIPPDDLLDMDLIILSHEYPRESSFLKKIEDKHIPIEYPETLFFRLAPPVTLIGIMGSVGKSTVLSMLTPMMEKACASYERQGFFTIDPDSDEGVLSHLRKIKSGDVVAMRIIEPIMRELYDMRISPHIAVFTTVPPRSAYHQVPFEILSFQTYNNFIIGADDIIDETHKLNFQTKAKMLRTRSNIIPPEWVFVGRGSHDCDNAALALQTARIFKISDEDAMAILKKWKGLRDHLEPVKKVKSIEFYNDSASVCASSTEAALKCLSNNKNVVLLFGGADNGSDYKNVYELVPNTAHTVILLPGSGTMKERFGLNKIEGVNIHSVPSVEEGVRLALEHAKKGDRVVFSPGFTANGLDPSRRDRGERFVKAVKAL